MTRSVLDDDIMLLEMNQFAVVELQPNLSVGADAFSFERSCALCCLAIDLGRDLV